jgi:hypothetical protein
MCLHLNNALVESNTDVDDEGNTRASLAIEPHDDGSGTALRFFQLARA